MDDDSLDALILSEPWDDEVPKTIQKVESASNDTDAPSKYNLEILRKYFGHNEFRPLQWKVINSVMNEKRDNCIVMATGYGKSLCYQYPAIFKCGLSVVISPLISLMEDQVQALEVANIRACFLGSAQTKKSQVMEDLLSGSYRLVYITPEYASSDVGLELLQKLYSTLSITLLAIDEAHCISQWGHDFRPAYRKLKSIRSTIPTTPILAVTATATKRVRDDIISALNLKNPQVLATSFDRPNLFFKVEKKSNDEYSDIMKIMKSSENKYNIANGSTIIYCLTKKKTDNIVMILNAKGITCRAYHAGLSIKERKAVHDLFIKDDIKIIVATIAFGMGIDKPNVRCVIHYGSSSDMEGYYQEAGRAGRDGNPSLCVLYHAPSDFVTHSILREKSFSSANMKSHRENLNAVMKQYVSTRSCRRYFILTYFDNTLREPENKQANCCDNCSRKAYAPEDSERYEGIDKDGLYDFSEDAEKFLKAILCFHPKSFGVGMIIGLLRGSKIKKLSPYFNNKNHGAGSSKSEIWWKQIAQILESEKLIKKEQVYMGTNQYPVTVMSDKGESWLNGKNNNKYKPIMLPPTEDMMQCLKIKAVKPLYTGGDYIGNTKVSTTTSNTSNAMSSGAQQSNKDSLTDEDQKLFNMLFELRHQLSKTKNVLPHVIASDVALQQFAKRKPLNKQQLIDGKFDGMSDTKIEKFGQEFVDKIKQFLQKNPSPVRSIEELLSLYPVPVSTIPNFGGGTQRSTLIMFQEGKSLQEISEERKLAASTIVTHLASAMRSTDDFDLSKLISASKLICIMNIIKNDLKGDTSKIAPIKRVSPPSISYDDIKFAMSYYEVRNHLKSLNIPFRDKYSLNINDKTFVNEVIKPDVDVAVEENENVEQNDDLDDDSWMVDSVLDDLDRIEADEQLNDFLGSANSSQNKSDVINKEDIIDTDDDLDTEELMSKLTSPINNTLDNKEKDNSENINLSNIDTDQINLDNKKKDNSENVKISNIDTIQVSKKEVKEVKSQKTKKIYMDSDSDEEEGGKVNLKRKLPDWMSNNEQAKIVMKAKMSKNTLFN